MRFYNPAYGSISVDGIPLESLDAGWLRSNFTLVEQTSLLFKDTVFKNIAFGRRDLENVTKTDVTKAVEFALLQMMITDMPDGLDTVVGYKRWYNVRWSKTAYGVGKSKTERHSHSHAG